MTMATIIKNTQTISTSGNRLEFEKAQSAFYEFREMRNRGEISEETLYKKYHTYRSAAYRKMFDGYLTFKQYSAIITIYPDDVSRIGWKNFDAHIECWRKISERDL